MLKSGDAAGELMLRAREKQPVQEQTGPPRRAGTGIRITGSTIVRFSGDSQSESFPTQDEPAAIFLVTTIVLHFREVTGWC